MALFKFDSPEETLRKLETAHQRRMTEMSQKAERQKHEAEARRKIYAIRHEEAKARQALLAQRLMPFARAVGTVTRPAAQAVRGAAMGSARVVQQAYRTGQGATEQEMSDLLFGTGKRK